MFPQAFSIGDIFLPTYGVMVALGFLSAIWLTGRLARRSGLNPEQVTNLGVYGALAGLFGAKLLMLLFDFNYYSKNPGEIFSLGTLQAGGVFYGGLILALGFAFWIMWRRKLPVPRTLDVFGPGLALGQMFGRIGCFAAGCCWGEKCDRPWAVTFSDPEAFRLTGVPLEVPLHPTQLYEAAAAALVFGTTFWWFRRPHRDGSVIGLYLLLTATARFIVESFRHHQQANPFGWALSNAQWISIALVVVGAWLVARKTTEVKLA